MNSKKPEINFLATVAKAYADAALTKVPANALDPIGKNYTDAADAYAKAYAAAMAADHANSVVPTDNTTPTDNANNVFIAKAYAEAYALAKAYAADACAIVTKTSAADTAAFEKIKVSMGEG
jgi:hypothetical protein